MPHPIHDILVRWLGSEQCAFDADRTVHEYYWPAERLPLMPDTGDTDEPEPQS